MSSSNSPPPPPSTSSLRNALGVTPGWGVGMSHSGSYVSTSTRTTSSIAVSTEESAAQYGGIMSILRKKKIWENSALKAAKLRHEQNMARMRTANNNVEGADGGGGQSSDTKARETAAAKANKIRNQLNQLFLQKTELEKSIQYEWKEKINEYEQNSLKEEEEEMGKLRQKHDKEMKQLAEKVKAANEVDEEKIRAALKSMRDDRKIGDKRKAADGEENKNEFNKKRKVEGGDSNNHKKGKGDDGNNGTSDTTKTAKDDTANGVGSAEKAEKEKELAKIVKEMSYLNKTKSQMVWLLKQVITTERKLKDKP